MAGNLTQEAIPDVGATVVVDEDRPVVGLTSRLTGALALGAETGRPVCLRTSAASAISYPLEVMITDGALQWVVAADDRDGPYDGISGTPLSWDRRTYQPAGDPPPAVDAAAGGPGTLRIEVAGCWPASDELDLGGPFEQVCRVLLGAAPTGWNSFEPIGQPWSGRALTAYARSRAPRPSRLPVLAGQGRRATTGLVAVDRTVDGVWFGLRLAVPGEATPATQLLDDLAAALAGPGLRSMSVLWQPGTADNVRRPEPLAAPVPVGLLIGPELITRRGIEHARQAPGAGGIVGPDAAPSRWCRFDPADPVGSLSAVQAHFALDG